MPGLTQVMVSTHTDDEWGYSNWTNIEVLRAGKLVCELPYESYGSHENHSGSSSSQLVLSSREPLRFLLRTTSTSNEFSPQESCTGYELLEGGTCRTLFEQACSEKDCTLTSTTSTVPGTGKLTGQVTRDAEPFVGASVVVEPADPQLAITDEHGSFSIDVSPGPHEIVVYGPDAGYSPNVSVSTRPDQDAHVSITIECPCCRAP